MAILNWGAGGGDKAAERREGHQNDEFCHVTSVYELFYPPF
jgi:hypothetical protein